MLADVDLPDSRLILDEVYEQALRFGQQTWVLHSVAALRDVSFKAGDWDAYLEQAQTEMEGIDGYCLDWLHSEEARRLIYRGDPVAAGQAFDALQVAPAIVASAQAMSWALAGNADALTAQGRFDEAYAHAEISMASAAETEMGFQASLFAAAAAGRPDR